MFEVLYFGDTGKSGEEGCGPTDSLEIKLYDTSFIHLKNKQTTGLKEFFVFLHITFKETRTLSCRMFHALRNQKYKSSFVSP